MAGSTIKVKKASGKGSTARVKKAVGQTAGKRFQKTTKSKPAPVSTHPKKVAPATVVAAAKAEESSSDDESDDSDEDTDDDSDDDDSDDDGACLADCIVPRLLSFSGVEGCASLASTHRVQLMQCMCARAPVPFPSCAQSERVLGCCLCADVRAFWCQVPHTCLFGTINVVAVCSWFTCLRTTLIIQPALRCNR